MSVAARTTAPSCLSQNPSREATQASQSSRKAWARRCATKSWQCPFIPPYTHPKLWWAGGHVTTDGSPPWALPFVLKISGFKNSEKSKTAPEDALPDSFLSGLQRPPALYLPAQMMQSSPASFRRHDSTQRSLFRTMVLASDTRGFILLRPCRPPSATPQPFAVESFRKSVGDVTVCVRIIWCFATQSGCCVHLVSGSGVSTVAAHMRLDRKTAPR